LRRKLNEKIKAETEENIKIVTIKGADLTPAIGGSTEQELRADQGEREEDEGEYESNATQEESDDEGEQESEDEDEAEDEAEIGGTKEGNEDESDSESDSDDSDSDEGEEISGAGDPTKIQEGLTDHPNPAEKQEPPVQTPQTPTQDAPPAEKQEVPSNAEREEAIKQFHDQFDSQIPVPIETLIWQLFTVNNQTTITDILSNIQTALHDISVTLRELKDVSASKPV
jgi:hypothetical protein